ncbi:ribosome silencing factor [Millisia brevis]|uniref:ribosome silencing factor n=1 Tax=Millisia brevis TaxID=264148 RepID=UPI00083378EE|nr:ribosome silencing factor [Millisia brevis]
MTAAPEAVRLAGIAALAADDKLATNVVVLDVSDQLVITDCFVIASAPNERQVNAIVDNIEDQLREAGAKPVRREGTREGRWTLLDYVDVVIHVQHEEERNFYALEKLWKDCPIIEVPGIVAHPAAQRPVEDAPEDDAVEDLPGDDAPLEGEQDR